MSDSLLDVQNFISNQLLLIFPVVGAIVLVLVFYTYSVGPAPTPSLFLVDEPISTKKERTLAKKKLKQQQKKQNPSNGHVSPETVASQQKASTPEPTVSKAVAESKTSTKPQVKKSATKSKATPKAAAGTTAVRDEKKEEMLAANRMERVQMKKEAQQGEWVTVVSNKDKKVKQVQQLSELAEELAEDAKQAIINEAKRLTAEAKAKTTPVSQPVDVQKSTPGKSKTKGSSHTVEPAKEAKSSKNLKPKVSGKEDKVLSGSGTAATTSNIPEPSPTPDIPAAAAVSSKPSPLSNKETTPDQPPQASGGGEDSVEKKIADAMQPAFDEIGDWEVAKPMKLKNVKKRARRDK